MAADKKSPRLDRSFSSRHLGFEEVDLSLERRQLLVQRRQARPAAHVERVQEVGDALDGPGNLDEVENIHLGLLNSRSK